MRLKNIVAIAAMAAALMPLGAKDAPYLAPELAARLDAAGGKLVVAKVGAEFDGKLALAPATGTLAMEARSLFAAMKPDILVEALYRIPAPGLASLPEADKLLRIANRFRAVSSLEGIMYFSQSHGDRRVLYTESYAVPSKDRTDRADKIPDPVMEKPEYRRSFPVIQTDASFGRLLFNYDFVLGGAETGFFARTMSPVMVFIFQAVAPGDLVLSAMAAPDGDSIVFYVVSGAKAGNMFGYQDKLKASFQNRADAVRDWLASYLK